MRVHITRHIRPLRIIAPNANEIFYRMNRGVHRFSSIAVLSIVQSAELGNNLPESNQYKEIEYTEQYSVCKYFLILSHRFCLSSQSRPGTFLPDSRDNSFTIPLIYCSKYTLLPPMLEPRFNRRFLNSSCEQEHSTA